MTKSCWLIRVPLPCFHEARFSHTLSKFVRYVQLSRDCHGVVKIAETIESLTLPGLLFCGLPNCAEPPAEDRSGLLLDKMADQATALMLAELAVTQDDESAMAVEEGRAAASGFASLIEKKSRPKRSGGWTNM